MTNHWTVLRIRSQEGVEELVALLQSILPTCGAHEVPTPDGGEWRLFFEPDSFPAGLEEQVLATAADAGYQAPRIQGVITVEKENWQDNWREYFQPVRISPTLEIRPSWHKEGNPAAPDAKAGLVLYIEPGMAFGTGTHATTQLCLRLCESFVRPNSRLLDCGTGSAILAIAAVKLGAGAVTAFDIDPEVEENARLNLQLNDLPPDAIDIRIGGLDAIPPRPDFDLIICNMLSREFLPLLPDLPRYLAPGASLILSGLLQSEEEEIRQAAARQRLQVVHSDRQEEWSALVCRAMEE